MSELKNPIILVFTWDTHGQGVQDQRVHIGVPELRGEAAEGLVHGAPVLPVLGVGVEGGGRGQGEEGGGEQQQGGEHGGEGWRGHTGRGGGGAAYLSRAGAHQHHPAAAHPRPAPRCAHFRPGAFLGAGLQPLQNQDQRRCRVQIQPWIDGTIKLDHFCFDF